MVGWLREDPLFVRCVVVNLYLFSVFNQVCKKVACVDDFESKLYYEKVRILLFFMD